MFWLLRLKPIASGAHASPVLLDLAFLRVIRLFHLHASADTAAVILAVIFTRYVRISSHSPLSPLPVLASISYPFLFTDDPRSCPIIDQIFERSTLVERGSSTNLLRLSETVPFPKMINGSRQFSIGLSFMGYSQSRKRATNHRSSLYVAILVSPLSPSLCLSIFLPTPCVVSFDTASGITIYNVVLFLGSVALSYLRRYTESEPVKL